jgi:hypothetical protein
LPPPGMMQAGTIPLRPADGGMPGSMPGIMPPGMMRAGTLPAGVGCNQNAASPGRGLAFYRATPIAMVPMRMAARQPNQVVVR